MAIIKVEDANNKTIEFDISKIQDINGDIDNEHTAVKDAMRNRLNKVHDVVYMNQKGETLDGTQVLQDAASGKVHIVALDIEMEATHSGKNHNYVIYHEDSMEKDCESFVNPFQKPVLKNHNSYSGEPLGRIKQSWHGPSQFTDERSAIHLRSRVTDQDSIPKFLDGRYRTFSIGGSMGTVTCNICGKTILRDGKFNFCGHWKGETYKDSVCYWSARDIEYNEISTVNTPADDYAQLTKVTIITDEDMKKENKDSREEGATIMDKNKEKLDQVASIIDSILKGEVEQPAAAPAVPPVATPATQDTAGKDGEKTIEDYKKELDQANQTITNLTTQLANETKKATDAVVEKEVAERYATSLKDQVIQLATSHKTMIIDRIVELEVDKLSLEDSKIEDRKTELLAKGMKDLDSVLDELNKKEAETKDGQRQPAAPLTNPTVPNTGEQGSAITDAQGNPIEAGKHAAEDSNSKKTTIDDYTNRVLGKLVK